MQTVVLQFGLMKRRTVLYIMCCRSIIISTLQLLLINWKQFKLKIYVSQKYLNSTAQKICDE